MLQVPSTPVVLDFPSDFSKQMFLGALQGHLPAAVPNGKKLSSFMHYIHCLWFSLMLKSQIAGVKYFLLNLVSDLEGPRSVPSALIEEILKTIHAASSESIKTHFLLLFGENSGMFMGNLKVKTAF